MTPDEINRRVAVEVMADLVTPDGFWRGAWLPSPPKADFYHSIADAMRVLEHLRSRIDTHGDVDRICIETLGGRWSVTIDCEGWSGHDLPAAICLAALKWKEAQS